MAVVTRLPGVGSAVGRRLSGLRQRLRASARRRRIDKMASVVGSTPAGTPLIAATRSGDVPQMHRLLDQGVDPSASGTSGWTALHEAVARRHLDAAALLLARGADPHRTDVKGHTPLGLQFTDEETLHGIRQRYHRLGRSLADADSRSSDAVAWAAELDQRGIVKVPGLVPPDRLKQLQQDFAAFIRGLDQKIAEGRANYRHYDEEEHWWPADLAYVGNNAFKHSKELIRLCGQSRVLETAGLYLGKPFLVQRAVAMRYLPARTVADRMFGWHHDMEEKRLKIMILLTEVGKGDQHMSYVPGSHRLFHPYKMFFTNTCSLDYCRQHLPQVEIYKALGGPGDAFFFDSNGAHMGTRTETGRVRDVYFVEYSADRTNVWGADMDLSVLDETPIGPDHPFRRLAGMDKKWTRPVTRQAPTWLENLPHVEQWL
jgi:hypothetical protein